MKNKKLILIIVLSLLFVIGTILILTYDPQNNEINIDTSQKTFEQLKSNDQVAQIPLISECNNKDCLLAKFKQCEQSQFNYNKEKSLYFAVLEKTDKGTCMVVLDLSMTKNLACNLKILDLTDKNFNEILGASTKNLSYLESIGCELQS